MSQQINLFNPVFMNQGKYFSVRTMLQMLGLIVLGAGLFYGYLVYHVKSKNVEFDEIGKRYTIEEAKLQRYTAELSPKESAQELEDQLKMAEAKLAAQNGLIETLKSGAIGNATGYSEYMRAFGRQAVNGLWLTGFTIDGDATQMIINGSVLFPDLLPIYINRLNREPVMHGKSFVSLQMQRGGNEGRSVEFTLQSE